MNCLALLVSSLVLVFSGVCCGQGRPPRVTEVRTGGGVRIVCVLRPTAASRLWFLHPKYEVKMVLPKAGAFNLFAPRDGVPRFVLREEIETKVRRLAALAGMTAPPTANRKDAHTP